MHKTDEIDYLAMQEACQKNPSLFLENWIGVSCWEKQKEILLAIATHNRVAIKSCHAAGKTWTMSHAALAFLYNHIDCIVLTTAPTGNQVFNIMWREIRGAFTTSKLPLGGELLKQSLNISENWYAHGFSTDNPDNARGFHSKSGHMLYIIDEAGGMDPLIMDAIDGTLTTNLSRVVYIGNPTSSTGRFKDAFFSPFFHKISIAVWDTPNFIANDLRSVHDLELFESLDEMKDLIITHPFLVTPQWAYIRMHEWGVDSPMFQSLVEANFPEDGERMLIPLHYIEQAMKREQTEEEKIQPQVLSFGVDVAKGNFGDSSVIVVMRGYEMIDVEWSNSRDPMELVGMVIRKFNELGGRINHDTITVDDTSLGGGVAPRLTEQGYIVNAISFGSSATIQNYTEKYANIKAQMFWNLRLLFQKNMIKILDKGKMIRHVSMMQYDIASSGAIKIVSKDEMRKKGLESSDFADALALAVWGVLLYGQVSVQQATVKKEKTISGNLLTHIL